MLSGLDCEYGHGYLFSRPMTASDFAEFARKQARPSIVQIGD